MSKLPQPPPDTTKTLTPEQLSETPNNGSSEREDVAKAIREKVQRGELSPQEARKLFEDLHKQLDA